MAHRLPLILLSGMAADERLFAPQRTAFPNLVVPPWIEPLAKESLPDYAARLARLVDPGRPCLVGGASFGGLVALEMAPHLQTSACVLISSVRSPCEFPWWYWLARPAAQLGPEGMSWCAGLVAGLSAPSLPPGTRHVLRRLSEPRAAFLRWASWAVLRWQPSHRAQPFQVWQIHGSMDRTFPIRNTRPDRVVAGGGHLLTLTHARDVNEFLHHAEASTAELCPAATAALRLLREQSNCSSNTLIG